MSRRPFLLLAWLWCFAAGGASAEPALRCLWTPPPMVRRVPLAGVASVQYTQLFDDDTTELLARALPPDRTFTFRYDEDRPDDHVFPNGVSMKRMHEWLTHAFEVWNREPLMPVRLRLERGLAETDHIIVLDDDSSQTVPNSGIGGYSLRSDGTDVEFRCQAVFNVGPGSLTRPEFVEALVKHELGHCMTLRHSSSRASVMGYTTGSIDQVAAAGRFALDDLLGLRSVWARLSPGFGALAGLLLYPDGSVVGGGDVAAVDAETGELLATGVSDLQQEGRFRIELPAGRTVRLVAHPLHADVVLFGDHFMPPELLTPGDFAPTDLADENRVAAFSVPERATRELGAFTVAEPPAISLVNRDAPTIPLLPGERRHVAFRYEGLDPESLQARLSLSGLSVTHLTTIEDRIEFDVTASADLDRKDESREARTGLASLLEMSSGPSSHIQAGSLWVRPTSGLVLATGVEPIVLVRGQENSVVLRGYGLERVTGVRLVSADGEGELAARLTGTGADGLTVQVTVPEDAADGAWEILLATAEGEAPRAREPQPRLWTGTGQINAIPVLDLGDVPVGRPVEFSVRLTSLTAASYRVSSVEWHTWLGEAQEVRLLDVPGLPSGASGSLRVTLTPAHLGPTVVTFRWGTTAGMDAATEVRLWAIPASSPGDQ